MSKHAFLLYTGKIAFKNEKQKTFWNCEFYSTERLKQNC
jgi:hypothetical protein